MTRNANDAAFEGELERFRLVGSRNARYSPICHFPFFKRQPFGPTSQTKEEEAWSREVNCGKVRDFQASEGRLNPGSTLP